MRNSRTEMFLVLAASLVVVAGGVGWGLGWGAAEEVVLGPRDGYDLPATEVDRLSVGDLAPDFTLGSYDGDVITLSDFRGKQNVVLVFYRGHW